MADALDYVHRRGYIHRDVKPDVIVLDDDGRPRLSGFGIALQQEDSEPNLGGTPLYMAPEQVAGDQLGPTTDIWGLGATLYECLTGRGPHEHGKLTEIVARIVETDPRPVSTIDPTIPDELNRICMKCLSRIPSDR